MPIPFTCPHCGVRTDVADEYAGQTGPCVGCGRMVTIPPLTGTPGYSASASSGGGAAVLVIVLVVVVGILAVVACGGFLFLARSSGPRNVGVAVATADNRAACQGNLQRIGLAMQSYHNAHGCFPPAYLADKDGKPMHSWRVLLLPHLGQQQLYDQYRLTEPWDSQQNASLALAIGNLYQCPNDAAGDPTETSYAMIVGPGTISDGPNVTALADITRGASNTIMVVEVRNSGIGCMEPRDVVADKIAFGVNGALGGIGSTHVGGAHVLFCDGSVRFLSDSADAQAIRAMTAVSGDGDPAVRSSALRKSDVALPTAEDPDEAEEEPEEEP